MPKNWKTMPKTKIPKIASHWSRNPCLMAFKYEKKNTNPVASWRGKKTHQGGWSWISSKIPHVQRIRLYQLIWRWQKAPSHRHPKWENLLPKIQHRCFIENVRMHPITWLLQSLSLAVEKVVLKKWHQLARNSVLLWSDKQILVPAFEEPPPPPILLLQHLFYIALPFVGQSNQRSNPQSETNQNLQHFSPWHAFTVMEGFCQLF